MSAIPSQQRRALADFQSGRYEAARRAFAEAVARSPRDAALREALAETLARLHRWSEAETEARAALELAPSSPSIHDLLGRAALERADHAAALTHLSASLGVRPAHAGTLVNLGVVLHRIGEWEPAVSALHSALRLKPDLLAARLGLSLALLALGRSEEGLEVLAPVSRHPMARFNAGFIRAHRGELAEGLSLMEARLELRDPGAGLGRLWKGESLEGTLLVVPEQGLGDVLLMCGFLAALPSRAREVILLAPQPLARLFETSFPSLQVVTSAEGLRPEAHVSIMSLAHLHGVRSADGFPSSPWLTATATPARAGRPRVGLNWAGNPRYAFDAIRSTSLATLAPLLEETGVEWVSLHKGVREAEAHEAGLPCPLEECEDFHATAQVLAGLDLVISTETAVPNLSAALGIPTVVLTHPSPDWRWLHAHSGITTAAQERLGDWSRPLTIARARVRSLVAAPAAA